MPRPAHRDRGDRHLDAPGVERPDRPAAAPEAAAREAAAPAEPAAGRSAHRGRFLLVPLARAGAGTGHLRRCLRLAARLGREATLLLEPPEGEDPGGLLRGFGLEPAGLRWIAAAGSAAGPAAGRWEIVLLDRRSTTREELGRYLRLGTVVGLDEGGRARRYAPLLIDTLPALRGAGPANLSSPAYLELPERRRRRIEPPFRRVLLAFGGEDAAGLSGRLLDRLLGGRLFAPSELTVVEGPRFRPRSWPPGIRRLERPADLKGLLHGFDLVFTMFGLTCFEALAAGVPVIGLNPSGYHRRLCRAAGIPEIGVRRPSLRKLRSLLADPVRLAAPVDRLQAALRAVGREAAPPRASEAGRPAPAEEARGAAAAGAGLAALLQGLHPSGAAGCPACGSGLNPAVGRFPSRTYFACRRCGLIYLLSFRGEGRRYGSAYFFEEYRAQYGRTYLEDFESIRRAGHARLEVIERLRARRPPGGRLLDVGCAMGPFLQAARERGFEAAGVDLSAEAVEYVSERLGFPAARLDFQAASAGGTSADAGERRPTGLLAPGSYDVLTFWYVIEHFRDLDSALRRANLLLKRGGLLALSTPNGRGISGRKDRRAFLGAAPADHFTVWNPRSACRVLARYGFRVRKVRVTGHHPERFPRLRRGCGSRDFPPQDFPPGSLRPRILMAASRLLGLGDTFEVYAEKVAEAGSGAAVGKAGA